MGLSSPWLLFGLLAAGVPVWLHFRKRESALRIPFSSIVLFEARPQQSAKRRKLDDIKLLLLRLALIAVIVLAFAKPYLKGVAVAGPAVVIAIDNSFSMQAEGRLAQAQEEAIEFVRKAGQPAIVVEFASATRFLTEPPADAATVESAIRSIRPSDSRSEYAQLARALDARSEAGKMPLEVHVFSDMQNTSLPASLADAQIANASAVVLHRTGPSGAGNRAVLRVSAPQRIAGPDLRVAAAVAGFGSADASVPVSLIIDGRVLATKQVRVPGNGQAEVAFDPVAISPGVHRGYVLLAGGDVLPGDDRFNFTTERTAGGRVLFLADDAESPVFFRAALAATAPAMSAEVHAAREQRPLSQYAFAVVSDPAAIAPDLEAGLRQYAERGGALLIAAGPNAAARGRVPVLGTRISAQPLTGGPVSLTDSLHPVLSRIQPWEGVTFVRAFRGDATGRVLARFGDGTPLLIESRIGNARALVLYSSLNKAASDFPLRAGFVAFIDKTVKYLAGVSAPPAGLAVDSWLDLAQGDSVVSPENPGAGGRGIRLASAGFYEVKRQSGRRDLIAANVDRRESDLRPADPETLALWTGKRKGRAQFQRRETVFPLWPYLLAIAVVLAAAESFVANRRVPARKALAAERRAA